MKITALERSPYLPFVPKYLIRDDGKLVLRDGRVMDSDDNESVGLSEPVEIHEGEWVAILEDGTPHILAEGEEERWRAEKAMEIVSSLPQIAGVPGKAVSLMLAASGLVGVSLRSMMEKLEQARQSPDETLPDIFKRLRAEGK